MSEESEVNRRSRPVRLRLKHMPPGVPVLSAIWLHERHLPPVAIKEKRGKVFAGEVFEVESKEVAQEYLDKHWYVEVAP